MSRYKTLLFFVLKAIIIYVLLTAPFSFYDEMYGNFYRSCGKLFFDRFHGNGIARFTEGSEKKITRIDIGNITQLDATGQLKTAWVNTETRGFGYLPTVLMIALVIASPVSWRRKLIALLAGVSLVTLLVMFRLWLQIMYLCEQFPWLNLYQFGDTQKKIIEYVYQAIVIPINMALYFVIIVWLLVTFRKEDLKWFARIQIQSPSKSPAPGQNPTATKKNKK
jgi:hypothetical protein